MLGGCRPCILCGVPAGSTGLRGCSSSFPQLVQTPGSVGQQSLLLGSLLFSPFSFFSLTKDHRKRPKYNKLLVSIWGPSLPLSQPCSPPPVCPDTQGLSEASRKVALVLNSPLGPRRNTASLSAMRRWKWMWRPGSRMSWQRPSHRGLVES